MNRELQASFDTLFQQHVAAAFERQLRFGDIVGDRAWNFSMTEGTLSFAKQGFFGKTLPLAAQILGTESESSSTWLWAWANQRSAIPEGLLRMAHRLQELGDAQGIAELVKPQLPLEELDGHQVGLVASGIHGRGAYYRCPYDGGAMFVLLPDVALPKVEHPSIRVATVFPQVIDKFEIDDHRTALRGLLESLGFTLTEDTAARLAGTHGQWKAGATFDGAGRMTELQAS